MKKSRVYLFYMTLVVSILTINTIWSQVQLGVDLDGEAAGDESGRAVSLDGNRVAIGAPENGGYAGHVRVYEWIGAAWVQLGDDIDGDIALGRSGRAVSLDSNRVAIGVPYAHNGGVNGVFAGRVQIYEWTDTAWVQMGGYVDSGIARDEFGMAVSLDGNRVAIGAPNVDSTGYVQIYEWTGAAWVQLGGDIKGDAAGYRSEQFVSLDGNRVAIGAPYNSTSRYAGHVRIYEWTGATWVQLGGDIDGEASGDRSGWSVSLDGNRVAIGADGNNYGDGHVRIYEWTGATWVQLGGDIDGDAPLGRSGWSVSLDGNRVAIGAPGNYGSNHNITGHVRIYEWTGTAWVQLGVDIDGDAVGDESGWAVSLDGNRVAIGAPENDWPNPGTGYVRVYDLSTLNTIQYIPTSNLAQVHPNPVTDLLQIAVQGQKETTQFQLVDLQGKIVAERVLTDNQTIDMRALPSGVYFYTIQTDTHIQTGKVTKK